MQEGAEHLRLPFLKGASQVLGDPEVMSLAGESSPSLDPEKLSKSSGAHGHLTLLLQHWQQPSEGR